MSAEFVYEPTETGYRGYVMGLPEGHSVIVTAPTKAHCEQFLRDAFRFHLEGLREGDEC